MPSDLVTRQHRFALQIASLLYEAARRGYLVAGGEWYRPGILARWYAKLGIGIANSKHCDRLAFDLILRTSTGVYLTKTKDYEELGKWWESMGGTWGGRFLKADGNHFQEAF